MTTRASNYQDFGAGGRDCDMRYRVIAEHLPRDRSLTVLDVGSNMGYFSVSIAHDFPRSLVYSIEHNKGDIRFHRRKLREAALENNYIFRCLLDKTLAAQLFDREEVFDVTLLLSVVHHFHYPLEEWCQMVGNFVRHSALTFFELPSLEDQEDIAAIAKFRSWYSRFPADPYAGLVQEMLRSARLDHCRLDTLRGPARSECSKDTRHILLVTNDAVQPDTRRFHCLSLANNPGFFLAHPAHRYWEERGQDARSWCRNLPGRVFNRLRRMAPRRGPAVPLAAKELGQELR